MLLKLMRQLGKSFAAGRATVANAKPTVSSGQVRGQDEVPDLSGVLELARAGRTEEAEQQLRTRLASLPDDADTLHLLGLLCHQSGRSAEATGLIGRAIALAPAAAFMRANFAEVLRVQGELDQAEYQAREAVRLAPAQADSQFNLAAVLADRGSLNEAIVAIDAVLALQPGRAEAVSLKSNLCFRLQRADEGFTLAQRARELAPDNPALLAQLMRLRADVCDWRSRTADVAALAALLERRVANASSGGKVAGAEALGGMNPFVPYEYPVPQTLRDAVTDLWAQRVIQSAGMPLDPVSSSGERARQSLRIGYVSADFHSHPTMHLMASFFGLHDRTGFEIFAYSIGADDGSEYRRRVATTVDRFVDIRAETPRQSAERIRRDGIDILVDLKGFTHEARPAIFALRPAPLRVAWLGYPASTGSGLNDYAVVDRVTVPPEMPHCQAQFQEKLVWMPHSYQVNDFRQPIAAVPARSGAGLPENAIVFACFNHSYKIEPEVFGAWMRILARVPHGVLWLYGMDAVLHGNLAREAQAHRIDPARIVFGGTLPKPQHLARLACADLFLDTGTINAHTSASDALWAGVPVLTCPGQTFASRVAASLVTAAGLPQCVCNSLQQYEDEAVRLAQAPGERAALRAVLQARERLPLFDTPRFARHLEQAFRMMWARHQSGAPPASFAVEDASA